MKKLFILLCIILPGIMYGQGMNVMHNGNRATYAAETGGGDPPAANMLVDGDFAQGDDTYWILGSYWSVVSNALYYDNTGISSTTQIESDMNSIIEVDTDYKLTFDITSSAPGIWIRFDATDDGGSNTTLIAGTNYTTGSYDLDFTSPGTIGGGAFTIYAWGDEVGSIDNIVLTER